MITEQNYAPVRDSTTNFVGTAQNATPTPHTSSPLANGPHPDQQNRPDYIVEHEGRYAVCLRKLHRVTGNNVRYFPDWFKGRAEAAGIAENVDYVRFSWRPEGKSLLLDFVVSVDTAIKLVKADNRTRLGTLKGELPALVAFVKTMPRKAYSFGVKELSKFVAAIVSTQENGGQTDSASVAEDNDNSQDSNLPQLPLDEAKPETPVSGSTPPVAAFDLEPEPSAITPSILVQMAKQLLYQAEMINELDKRLSGNEKVTGQIVAIEQRSALAYLGLDKSQEVPPEQTLRSKITEVVNKYCRTSGEDHETVYARIYNHLLGRYRVNIRAYQKKEDETHLAVAERNGHLDKIVAIIKAGLHMKPESETTL